MPTYRRIVEVHTGEDRNIFRTIRLDVDLDMTDDEILAEWADVLAAFRLRYETQVRFVPPRDEFTFAGYMPRLPGEEGWDWAGEDEVEI
jgi:hypothetical protein